MSISAQNSFLSDWQLGFFLVGLMLEEGERWRKGELKPEREEHRWRWCRWTISLVFSPKNALGISHQTSHDQLISYLISGSFILKNDLRSMSIGVYLINWFVCFMFIPENRFHCVYVCVLSFIEINLCVGIHPKNWFVSRCSDGIQKSILHVRYSNKSTTRFMSVFSLCLYMVFIYGMIFRQRWSGRKKFRWR